VTRYHEGPSVTVSTVVLATPEVVWPLLIDLNLPAEFSNEFQGAEWLDDGAEPFVGRTFRGHNSHPRIGSWSVTCTVTECEPQRVFGWKVGDVTKPAASWRYTLEPHAEGTLLTQWAEIGPGPSGLTPMITEHPEQEEAIVASRLDMLRPNMAATIEGIRRKAEAAS
jgi:hypothetical protein